MKRIYPLLLLLYTLACAQPQTDPIAEDILIMQRTSGGWPKHIPLRGKKEIKVDYEKMLLTDEERAHIQADSNRLDATYDNGATTKEIRYLLEAYAKTNNPKYLQSAERGIRYILEGQYKDTGGWPQFYPLRGGYPNHITYNDNSMVNCLNVLYDLVNEKNGFEVVDKKLIAPAQAAIEKGITCILNTQIVKDGKKTVWCAQHDEFTFAPAKARAYELPSFSGSESVDIVRFLMRFENPSDSIVDAIQNAIVWFEAHKIPGYKIEQVDAPETARGFDKALVADANHTLWARFYDLDTGKPYFCGRDGIKKEDFQDIEYERRVGYAWYGTWPQRLLEKEYPKWLQTNSLD